MKFQVVNLNMPGETLPLTQVGLSPMTWTRG